MIEMTIDPRWARCKNILCVRTDNMGDLLMSSPAFQLLKKALGCRITLLTSPLGEKMAAFLPEIDEVIVGRFPWVKGNEDNSDHLASLLRKLSVRAFDAAIIFTVYSQTALPAGLLLYMADIPLRLAYARENPYHLLTDWAVDEEPLSLIRHQVERDCQLLGQVGISGKETRLTLKYDPWPASLASKFEAWGIAANRFFILHPGVSEEKREYPLPFWKKILKELRSRFDYPVVLTGSAAEKALTDPISEADPAVINAAGSLSIAEWIALIAKAAAVVSVNTATIHIASALERPILVLYANTNPQHTPWNTRSEVLPFSVPAEKKSLNQLIRYVDEHHYGNEFIPPPQPAAVVKALAAMLDEVSPVPKTPA